MREIVIEANNIVFQAVGASVSQLPKQNAFHLRIRGTRAQRRFQLS
jgi:hypothetical protein